MLPHEPREKLLWRPQKRLSGGCTAFVLLPAAIEQSFEFAGKFHQFSLFWGLQFLNEPVKAGEMRPCWGGPVQMLYLIPTQNYCSRKGHKGLDVSSHDSLPAQSLIAQGSAQGEEQKPALLLTPVQAQWHVLRMLRCAALATLHCIAFHCPPVQMHKANAQAVPLSYTAPEPCPPGAQAMPRSISLGSNCVRQMPTRSPS
jgi:hypothetical protein